MLNVIKARPWFDPQCINECNQPCDDRGPGTTLAWPVSVVSCQRMVPDYHRGSQLMSGHTLRRRRPPFIRTNQPSGVFVSSKLGRSNIQAGIMPILAIPRHHPLPGLWCGLPVIVIGVLWKSGLKILERHRQKLTQIMKWKCPMKWHRGAIEWMMKPLWW